MIEGMPTGSDRNEDIRGRRKPSAWQPYKLWEADLWECPDCGHELVVGYGRVPMLEHYQDGFKQELLTLSPLVQINDC